MPEPLSIAILNASSICPDSEIRHYVAAIQAFMPKFTRAWGLPEIDVGFIPKGYEIRDEMWLQIVADDAEQAGYLGYHETTKHGYPIGYTFAATGRPGGSSISVTLSHELWEMLGDPMIDQMVTGPDGRQWVRENADACEADEYGIRVAMPGGLDVILSDFVLPSYFDFTAPAGVPYDYAGKLLAPIPALLPGGYMAYQEPSGAWGQIDAFQDRRSRAKARPAPLSRRYRRAFRDWGGPA